MNDSLQFLSDENNDNSPDSSLIPWTIVVIDDEEQVHQVTKLTLNRFTYKGRGLHIISAYSGAEAREVLAQHSDVAVALIDVVMETDTAGLELTQYIRKDLKNESLRIVLRTGQPGQAPESDVIKHYDINDYKSKTELTVQKLYTLLYSTLRSYERIKSLENNQQGLEYIIDVSNQLMSSFSFEQFCRHSLQQLTLFFSAHYQLANPISAIVFQQSPLQKPEPVKATGKFAEKRLSTLPVNALIASACEQRQHQFEEYGLVLFCQNTRFNMLYYIEIDAHSYRLDVHLLTLFARHLSMALENVLLIQEVSANQKEMIYRLSAIAETRSLETGNHIKRVSLYCNILAKALGIDEQGCEMISLSSALHDIGKVGITDDILHKPGKLDAQQWETMQKHAQLGYDMLANSEQPLLELGSEIARNHHERWDGKGYPKGLQGEQIPLAARICTVADVFDALGSKRAYKQPWSHQDVVDYMLQQKNKMFDPKIVDLLVKHIDDICAVKEQFPD